LLLLDPGMRRDDGRKIQAWRYIYIMALLLLDPGMRRDDGNKPYYSNEYTRGIVTLLSAHEKNTRFT
jgi:hypothetical protein